jgi:putative transposase
MPMGKKHTPEQIVGLLRDAEDGIAAGRTLGRIGQEIGVSRQTYYRWKSLSCSPLRCSHP